MVLRTVKDSCNGLEDCKGLSGLEFCLLSDEDVLDQKGALSGMRLTLLRSSFFILECRSRSQRECEF